MRESWNARPDDLILPRHEFSARSDARVLGVSAAGIERRDVPVETHAKGALLEKNRVFLKKKRKKQLYL